jgi:serine-type D-Ala-D-Ala carboxypeptidase (penicillin-binding protein 5/6)
MRNMTRRLVAALAFWGSLLIAGFVPFSALGATRAASAGKPTGTKAGLEAPAVAALAGSTMPAPELPDIASYVLMDATTGTIIAEKAPTTPWPPASLVKLMTAYLTYHAVAGGTLKLEQPVPVNVTAWRSGGSRMFISPGMHVTVDELLHGLIIDSGNDAAVALAQAVAGTRGSFVKLMNATATKLGLDGTHYTNVSGLPDPDLYTTAADIATLSRAIVLRYPQYLTISIRKHYTFDKIRQPSWNPVLFHDPTVDGLKTGLTKESGHCIDATAVRDGRRLIAVELGGPTWSAGTAAVEALLDYGYSFYTNVTVATAKKPIGVLTDARLTPETIPVGAMQNVVVTVPVQAVKSISTTLALNSDPPQYLPKGVQVGTIAINLNEVTLARVPAASLAEGKPVGFATMLVRRLRKAL